MRDHRSITLQNVEAAFAGEAMAYLRYLYFARAARSHGDEATAKVFEETAAQEMQHGFALLDLLYPPEKMSPQRCLEFAIAGETHEYAEVYPQFRAHAELEGDANTVREMDEQIAQSKEHAARFRQTLALAEKRFAALIAVERRHASNYRAALARVESGRTE